MPRVTLDVAHYRTFAAQWPWVSSVGKNSKPFSENGDVSIWGWNSLWDVKPQNKTKIIDLKI